MKKNHVATLEFMILDSDDQNKVKGFYNLLKQLKIKAQDIIEFKAQGIIGKNDHDTDILVTNFFPNLNTFDDNDIQVVSYLYAFCCKNPDIFLNTEISFINDDNKRRIKMSDFKIKNDTIIFVKETTNYNRSQYTMTAEDYIMDIYDSHSMRESSKYFAEYKNFIYRINECGEEFLYSINFDKFFALPLLEQLKICESETLNYQDKIQKIDWDKTKAYAAGELDYDDCIKNFFRKTFK